MSHELKGISILISPGELLDKLSILAIKSERIQDHLKSINIKHEYESLNAIVLRDVPQSPKLDILYKDLKSINEKLWDIEDDIRDCERHQDFSDTFIQLARSVYITNDQRASIKKDINTYLGSQLVEEKSYHAY
ncbi:hypothetical protein DID74_00590 [Candidatus Marinamargulisbacteria bacterium SCGC AG-333-B06]|nr:hypothetical protein DID74_00590 [Candidatus Marinamargulisbacteria bacterium SCGC AG-333-B06]